jgi:hypothetical protein
MHIATEILPVRRVMDLEITTALNTLTDASIDSKSILVTFAHGLLLYRHWEPDTFKEPSLLLMHIRIESSLVKVDNRPFFHNVARKLHGKFDSLSFHNFRVFIIRIELSIGSCLFDSITNVEVSECMFCNIDSIYLLYFKCSLIQS